MESWNIISEFKSRKGNTLVVCDLMEHTPKVGVDQYIACPFCSTPELTKGYSDTRRRKLRTDGYVGYCYRCGRGFLNPRDLESDFVEMAQMNMGTKIANFDVPEIPIDTFETFSPLNDEGLEYLQGRNPIFSKPFCDALGFRSLNNGVAIPFYLDGKFVYYVIRFIKVRGNYRYMMPPLRKPLYMPIIVNKDNLIIVEGIFDAFAAMLLYPEYTPIAILGSKITSRQLNFLSERFSPKSILVYLDDTEKSKKTEEYIKLNWRGIYDIDIVESDGTDPEEKLKSILNG